MYLAEFCASRVKFYLFLKNYKEPISVAARSKAWVCSSLLDGIAGSNPAGGTDVFCLWVLGVVR